MEKKRAKIWRERAIAVNLGLQRFALCPPGCLLRRQITYVTLKKIISRNDNIDPKPLIRAVELSTCDSIKTLVKIYICMNQKFNTLNTGVTSKILQTFFECGNCYRAGNREFVLNLERERGAHARCALPKWRQV